MFCEETYSIICPEVMNRTSRNEQCDVPCLRVPYMGKGQPEAELRRTPHLAALADVNLNSRHNCVVLMPETKELGFIGAAYLAARQHDVFDDRDFLYKEESDDPHKAGLLPILEMDAYDTEHSVDNFGEIICSANAYAPRNIGVEWTTNPNRWILNAEDCPLLITLDNGIWPALPQDIAVQVKRRSLTIVVLPCDAAKAEKEEFYAELKKDLRFSCGAQIVMLKKPAADSAYYRAILADALQENEVTVDEKPYDVMLRQLDLFRRSHGGLCNENIRKYAEVLSRKCIVGRLRGELTLKAALQPIETNSQKDAAQAARDLAKQIKEQLCGCDKVKAQLESVVDLMQMDCTRRKQGLPTSGHGQILLFAGSPGTGKTTAARMLCDWLVKRELLATECQDTYKQVSGPQLKGAYVGHTAPLVKELFANNAFLFIDEAYALAESSSDADSYAQEAIAQLCIELENLPEDRVVVLAGYGGKQNRMRSFLDANPGLASRITATIQFDAYSPDREMPAIFAHHAATRGLTLPNGWEKIVVPYFQRRASAADYGSGREARRLLESCLTAQGHRLIEADTLDAESLCTLTHADLKAAIHQLESGFAALNTAKAARLGLCG